MRSTIVANVVMVGAFTSATNLVDAEAMRKAILSNVPKGTEKLNWHHLMKAMSTGRSF